MIRNLITIIRAGRTRCLAVRWLYRYLHWMKDPMFAYWSKVPDLGPLEQWHPGPGKMGFVP